MLWIFFYFEGSHGDVSYCGPLEMYHNSVHVALTCIYSVILFYTFYMFLLFVLKHNLFTCNERTKEMHFLSIKFKHLTFYNSDIQM